MTTAYITKRKKLATKIIDEHFEMTLVANRNINYLWYTYKTGTKRGEFRYFILGFEVNLLLGLNMISSEEKDNLISMFSSEDEDNMFIALMAIETLRKKRIKTHGEWTKKQDISTELRELVDSYDTKIITNKSLDKI